MYRVIENLVCRNGDGNHLEFRIREGIQNAIVKGLSHFYKETGIAFVGATSMRFAHQLQRYIKGNTVEFKLRDNTSDFNKDMDLFRDQLSEFLKVSVDLTVKREDKRRRLDNGFFIPYRIAVLKIYGIEYRVVMHNLPIGETILCSPYDELGIALKEEEILFEDLNSSLAHLLVEAIGDDKFDVSFIHDMCWAFNNGGYIDPEQFEVLINERHLSMLEIRFNNLQFTLRSNSTCSEFQDFLDCSFGELSERPTFNLQMKEISETISSNVTSVSLLFDERFEDKREQLKGFIKTEGIDAKVDGVNVKGFGKEAITNNLRMSK